MRNSGAALFPIALLAALAGLTFWLSHVTDAEDLSRRAKQRHDPDFFIERFTIDRFDSQGIRTQSLLAAKMTHYPDDDSTEVRMPDLTYHKAGRPTRIRADDGWLSPNGKEVRLKGNVLLVRAAAPGSPETVLQTEALTVFPDDEFARGQVPVTVRQGGATVSGNSIEYRGKENIVTLQGHARGTFPRKPE